MRFFVRNTEGKWEQVTQYVFDNRKWAVVKDERAEGEEKFVPRFQHDEYFTVNGENVEFSSLMKLDELGKICRFLGVTVPMGTYTPIVEVAENVLLHRANSRIMHVSSTGQNWVSQTPKKKKAA